MTKRVREPELIFLDQEVTFTNHEQAKNINNEMLVSLFKDAVDSDIASQELQTNLAAIQNRLKMENES
jgi:aspartyl-tRNA synthetase